MRRPITARHATLFVVAPTGLVEVGKYDGWDVNEENELVTYKPTDGTTLHENEGENHSGSLSRGYYDLVLADIIWGQMHPTIPNEARLILILVATNADGTVETHTYREVLIQTRKMSAKRGDVIRDDVTWVADSKDQPA